MPSAAPPSSTPSPRRDSAVVIARRAALWAGPVLAALVVYANALGNGFTLDDKHLVVGNEAIRSLATVAPWRSVVTDGGAFYRPVGMLSYAVDHALFGMRPAGFHLTSVLLHLLATALVARLALRLTSPRAAFFAALLFAVHPVHTEAVTNVANRPEVLATIFYLAALLVHARAERVGWRTALGENVLCLLALASKESAITLPLAVFALEAIVRRAERPWVAAARLLPAVVLYLLLRDHALGRLTYASDLGYFQGTSWQVRALTVTTFLPRYALLLIAPVRLSADYSRFTIPDATGVNLAVAAGLCIAAAFVGAIAIGRRRAPVEAMGLSLLGVGLLTYLHLTVLGSSIAERFLYLPSAGAALAAGAGLARLAARVRPRVIPALVGAIAIGYGLRTADRNLDWRDDITLWTRALEVVPRSEFARASLGTALCATGRTAQGLPLLERAYAVSRADMYLADLASCHLQAGHAQIALQLDLEGQRRFPDDARFRHGAALARVHLGDAPGALREAVEGLRRAQGPREAALVRSIVIHHPDPTGLLRAIAQSEPEPLRGALLSIAATLPPVRATPAAAP